MADQVGRMVKTRGDQRHLGGNIIGGDPNSFEPDVADWLAQRDYINTVLDVGCGEGQMVQCFQYLGCQAIGLDGLQRNAEAAETLTIVWDITDGPLKISNIDLVWCVEVAEHIDEIFIDDFIATISNGTFILMTAAKPGQAGYHHVNCRGQSYWVAKMEKGGYQFQKDATKHIRSIAHGFVKDTGMLFMRSPEC